MASVRGTAVDGEPLAPPLDAAEAARRRGEIRPTPGPRRTWIVVAAGVVVLAVAIGILSVGGGDEEDPGPTSPTAPPANSLIAFDPESETVEYRLSSVVQPTGGGLPNIAIDGGEVWIRTTDMVHVDGSTGEIRQEHRNFACCEPEASFTLAIGERTVWAPSGLGEVASPGTLNRLDWTSGDILEPIRLRRSSPPSDVAVGLGAVWVSFRDGSVERRDPFTGRLLDEFTVSGTSIDALLIAGDTPWVLDQLTSEVIRLDPDTGAEIARVALGGSPRTFVADDRRVWVLDPSTSTVTPISVSTSEASSPIGSVGDDPTGIAVGLDAVWVSDSGGSVLRVDPTDGSTEGFEVGPPLTAIAVDPETGLLWLTVGA